MTCCFLDEENNIWFHDGQNNDGNPIYFKNITQVQMSDLIEFNGQIASIYIFATLSNISKPKNVKRTI